jgi:hypothetical protein
MRLWRDDAARMQQLQAAARVTAQGAEAFNRTVASIGALVGLPAASTSRVNASA